MTTTQLTSARRRPHPGPSGSRPHRDRRRRHQLHAVLAVRGHPRRGRRRGRVHPAVRRPRSSRSWSRAACGTRPPAAAGSPSGSLGLLAAPVVFWSGIPLVLGAGATLLGQAGRRADHGSGKAIAAFVLGLLTLIAYAGVYVGDYLSTH